MVLLNFTPVLRHSDALGYLKDLAKDLGEQWFEMVCDLAAVGSVSTLDQHNLDVLFALYKKKASYLGVKPSPASPSLAPASSSADFLEELSGFTNFKLLRSTLQISFKKRITLIFGATGSGKSSLCESLKALANPERPSRPLHNVRRTGAPMPAFCYKFQSDSALLTWNQAVGYGPRQGTIKYFDTGIAIRNVRNPVEPGRLIELTPFKLHVFESAMALTAGFRKALQQTESENLAELTRALQAIRTEFARFSGFPLSTIDDHALTVLSTQIKLGEGFAEQTLLNEKRIAAAELEKAASKEGLKLLKAEHHELESFLASVGTLLDSADSLWLLQPMTRAGTLAAKKAEQKMLGKTIIPKDGTLENLLTLLRAASQLCKLEAAADHACPLCKRDLGTPEVNLFKQYHKLLAGELEKQITELNADIAKAEQLSKAVSEVNREEWDKSTTIPTEILTPAKTCSDLIVANCKLTKEPSSEARVALESLRTLSVTWAQQLQLKTMAIEAATKGREEPAKQLSALRGSIETLEYAQSIFEMLDKLKDAQRMTTEANFWRVNLPAFTQLQKKITERAKQAHKELVVADFESRLNAEYRILTDKDICALGVKLRNIGDDAIVTILPQIGDQEIENVLSEGEQRVHALALFFAELETCPQSVLVFDDPVSSFDYNYIFNYCTRLRDFAVAHPTRQIIVLTHNWEFFVQLQTTLNKAALNGHLAVQVLENCSEVAEYSEEVDQLKAEITDILGVPGEPSKKQKEELAGKLRRLIEAIVNSHVFNKQRHQYKQKSQTVSEFQHFTKLVPLLPAEATTLRDLFEVLSIPEHSDPRNAYVNTDKSTFRVRYDRIIAIEAAVVLRK